MKKIIILIAVFTFAVWGCEKDLILDPVSFSDLNKMQDSITFQPQSNANVADSDIIYPQFNPNLTYGSVADIDGNIYKTIQIGNQVWMAENLKTTRYNDGSPIFLGKGDIAGETDWFDLVVGAYCWFENNLVNKSMGALYNWHAIRTDKLAPAGWHVPTNEDWQTLIGYWGGETKANQKLVSSGSNESGFSAVPSPNLCGWGFGPELTFWSATSYQNPYAYKPYAYYLEIWKENLVEKVSLHTCPQSDGLCVRCVKN